MSDWIESARIKQRDAQSQRKKGDAMRTAKREEQAIEAYKAGIASLDQVLARLDPNWKVSSKREAIAKELVEVYGTKGGLLQRAGNPEPALVSYSLGAEVEEQFVQDSTYNRLNAIKHTLLTGKQRLSDLKGRLDDLAHTIDQALDRGGSISDSGWAWADLGDCRALLGDLEPARRAYQTFIAKAETKSPDRTLDVLRQIAAELRKFGDKDADNVTAAISVLESQLTAAR